MQQCCISISYSWRNWLTQHRSELFSHLSGQIFKADTRAVHISILGIAAIQGQVVATGAEVGRRALVRYCANNTCTWLIWHADAGEISDIRTTRVGLRKFVSQKNLMIVTVFRIDIMSSIEVTPEKVTKVSHFS